MNEISSSADAELRRRIGMGMLGMLEALEQQRDSAAKEYHLHPTDFACIAFLQSQAEPISPKQIVGWLRLSSSSGTALLDRLERAGYIRRVPNPADRRSVLIELDRAAAQPTLDAYQQRNLGFRKVIEQFSAEELEIVARFLEAMGEYSAEQRGGPAGA